MYPAKWFGKSLLWEEKPNSGDILKLKIPSHNRKVIGGLNNYSAMVTSSLKMSENEMDYRGSKSTIWKSIVVKEQRVDGFLQKKFKNFSCIRYTLMGFEINYQVKIPFNQILQKRYSTSSNINNKLTPWCVTGFTDAEGCFCIRIRKDTRYKSGYNIVALFSISLNKKDLSVLRSLKSFFGEAGHIWKENNLGMYKYRIESIKQINDWILPHFDKYPLLTKKQSDYLLFRKVIELINAKKHFNTDNLKEFVSIMALINKGLTDDKLFRFNVIPVVKPVIEASKTFNPHWIAGFVSGDGCFMIKIRKTHNTITKHQVILAFKITQHSRDKLLMENLISYFNCGILEKYSQKPAFYLSVYKFLDNYEKILPFFNKYNVIGCKHEDFKTWAKVAELIKQKKHLEPLGLKEIFEYRTSMNKRRI